MAAGLATLELISEPGFFTALSGNLTRLLTGIKQAAETNGVSITTTQAGGMFGLFFTDASSITSYRQSTACDKEIFNRFFHGMLENGVYLAPSSYEAGFISSAHGAREIEKTIDAAATIFEQL